MEERPWKRQCEKLQCEKLPRSAVKQRRKIIHSASILTIRRLACLAYWGMLTVLLLVPNPAMLLGLRRMPEMLAGGRGSHLLAFVGLALVVYASRWPNRIAAFPSLLLVLYAVIVETLQILIPTRSVELVDYGENLLGITLGAMAYWAVQRVYTRRIEMPREADYRP